MSAPVMAPVFTARQAYAATLAMRIGKAVPIATIQGWSPQQLQQAISSANTALSKAQALASAPSYVPVPVKPHQQAAIAAWAQAMQVQPPQCGSSSEANGLLVQAGKNSAKQLGLVANAYALWLAAAEAGQSQQLSLF